MCVPTLFSACGDLIGKLTCQNRCNWRCCTHDHIEVHINGTMDERMQTVAGAAIDGGPPPEPVKDEETSGGLPPFLAKLFKKKEPAPVSSGGSTSAIGRENESFFAPVPLQPFAVSTGRVGEGSSASSGAGVFRGETTIVDDSAVATIILTELTHYLFKILKKVEDDAVFTNTYQFSPNMIAEIRELFENCNFSQDLNNHQTLNSCSIKTMELLTQFEAKYQTILLATKQQHPNP